MAEQLEMFGTVSAARKWLFDHYEDPGGVRCPCCDKNVHLDNRSIRGSWAACLIWMHTTEMDEDGYIHINERAPRRYVKDKDTTWLAHWGLIETKPNDDMKKTRSGRWKLTDLGRDFVLGNARVPKTAKTYNARVVRWHDNGVTVNITQALKAGGFDYNVLMGYGSGASGVTWIRR